MEENLKYSIVIPVYNEETNLTTLYDRLKPVVNGLGDTYEIILVNDGSSDSSRSILEEMASKDATLVIVNFAKNFGQHPAVAAGLLQAKGDVVITLDADLQNPPEEIPKLVIELDKGYDMVSGRRSNRKDTLFRKIPSYATNLIISTITGVRMKDYGSMLRAFRQDTAKKLAEAFLKKQAYITMLIPAVTKNIKEISVAHDERFSSTSKYGMFRLIDTFLRIFFTKSRKDLSDISDIFVIDSVVKHRDK